MWLEAMTSDPDPVFLPPGLRTLCFAVADVSESSYQQWLEIQHRASTSLQNRALKLEESYELIEKVTETVCVSVCACMCGRVCCEFPKP